MRLNVKLFARAREIAGVSRVAVDVPDTALVADLRIALAQQWPELRALVPNLLVAVGTDYADDRTALTSDCEIACFPPVSGG